MDVPSSVFGQPDVFQEFIAAHEYAHIYLGHRPWRGELAALACRAGLIVAGVAALMAVDQDHLSLVLAIFVWSLIAAVLVGQAVSAAYRRPLETAADDQAARWGFPLTPVVAERLEATEPKITRYRWFAPFRTHPEVRLRARHLNGVRQADA